MIECGVLGFIFLHDYILGTNDRGVRKHDLGRYMTWEWLFSTAVLAVFFRFFIKHIQKHMQKRLISMEFGFWGLGFKGLRLSAIKCT